MTDFFTLLVKTILFRPYVYFFLAAFLVVATQLIGWRRAWRFGGITWLVAYVCEVLSTSIGIPFGLYIYNGSTLGQELYLFHIPFMSSLSFSFLLYAAYCVALCLLLPIDQASTSTSPSLRSLRFDMASRTSGSMLLLTSALFALIDMVIDPVALRGDRWFLGKIYYYAEPGIHFGVPISNYVGWMVVGVISLSMYFVIDRRLDGPSPRPNGSTTPRLLLGVGLYYMVLVFNLGVTFWIGEWSLGISGVAMYLPITLWLLLRLTGSLRSLDSSVGEPSTTADGN